MSVRIVTADDLCRAAQQLLVEQLPGLITALGLNVVSDDGGKAYKVLATWAQVPTLEALQTAVLPAGAITWTGTVGEVRKSSLGYDATWRVRVGLFDRAEELWVDEPILHVRLSALGPKEREFMTEQLALILI